MYNVKGFKSGLVVISVLSSLFIAESALAKGGVSARDNVTFPATCTGETIAASYIYKSKHGNFQFGISEQGAQSGGTIILEWYLNGVAHHTSTNVAPNNWVYYGLSAADAIYDGTVVTFGVVATNQNTGEVCNANVSWQF